MFEQSTLSRGSASRRVLGMCVGFAGQAVAVSIAVLAPMVFPQIIPRTTFTTLLFTPSAPLPPPVPVVRPRGEQRPIATQLPHGVLMAPVSVPPTAAIVVDPEPQPQGGSELGVPGGIGTAGPGQGVLRDILVAGAPTPPPPRAAVHTDPAPPPAPAAIPRVRVGTGVKLGRVLVRVEPVYPAVARQMRVAGVVELEGVVGTDGRLKELRVKSGPALLARAAFDAVAQWVYEPTTLNGRPVEVVAPITVTFRLN